LYWPASLFFIMALNGALSRMERRISQSFSKKVSDKGSRSVQKILDSAARLFGTDGFEGATMMAVARAAGVSKGLLHYHFRSKEHLLIEAQRSTFRQIHLRFEERFKRGEHGLDTALEGLDAMWSAVRDMRAWAPFMVETISLSSQQPAVRKHLQAFYSEADDLMEKGVRQAFSEEIGRLALPPERLTRLIRTTLHGLVAELAQAKTPEELGRVDQSYQDYRQLFAAVALLPVGATMKPDAGDESALGARETTTNGPTSKEE
jgi:AcrR family transcriptional regulator